MGFWNRKSSNTSTSTNPKHTVIVPATSSGSSSMYVSSGTFAAGSGGSGGIFTMNANVNTASTTFGTVGISSSNHWNTHAPRIKLSGTSIIETDRNKVDLDLLWESMQMINERLMILVEDPEILERHPTLRDAYDQYRTLAAMISTSKEENE